MGFKQWSSAALALCAGNALALAVNQFSPQGEVGKVHQVRVQFDAAAVRFGDPKAAAPLQLACSDAQATAGTGRWTSEREWVFDFKRALPPGVRCTAQLHAGFKSPSGQALTGTARWQFGTGGPQVLSIAPSTYEAIDEAQFFVLRFNGPVARETLLAHGYCALEGVGERIPLRWIDGGERKQLLEMQNWTQDAAAAPQQFATLACNRTLTAGAKMRLVLGAGIATPGVATPGVATRNAQEFGFTVREPFAAELRCERENAQAACLPIRPVRLSFNAPVPRALAEGIQLQGGGAALKAVVDDDEDSGARPDPQGLVERVRFEGLATLTRYQLQLPSGFKDAAGRTLRNADAFPLTVATADMPPLVKFAASPFGIVERFAEGPEGPALLPVTVRKVEAALAGQQLQPAGQVSVIEPRSDAEIIAWLQKLQDYDTSQITRERARRDVRGPLPPVVDRDNRDYVQTRMLSLLAGRREAKAMALPSAVPGDPRPFEVVGIPLAPGFHVVEIASPLLGAALLDERYGAQRRMYVRSSALVTNLAVHFKLGRENSAAWVTTLDKGQVVAGARVQVSNCKGEVLATATTDAQGLAQFSGLSPEPQNCQYRNAAYFVSARAQTAAGPELAFAWSDWQRGIEPWRFNVPTSSDAVADLRAHTIFDRTLLRAGETLSMKHLLRQQTMGGLALPKPRPAELRITHVGSGQSFRQPLAWRNTASGGLSAESRFAVPAGAKLGEYQVELRDPQEQPSFQPMATGSFRVEEFRLPVFEGSIGPADKKPLVRAETLPVQVQLNYLSGGPADGLPVRVSALVRSRSLEFAGHEDFHFSPPRAAAEGTQSDDEEAGAAQDTRVIADALPLVLDRQGAGRIELKPLPRGSQARELLIEASYADPSGEVQTLRSTQTLWPAAVVAGIQAENWVSTAREMQFQALALGLDGKPQAGVALEVQAVARITTSTRKRLVGGFYSYDNQATLKDLGTVCSGKSDAQGRLRCTAKIAQAGEVELIATATDGAGHAAQAATSVWVTRQGELWFGGEDHDRMELLPEQRSYAPGETARLQVRMPFRHATALVSVEREGILSTRVVQLEGQNPTVELRVEEGWGPNVYVSVLALRGRLREVPWYSFFTWGYQSPRAWWNAFWHEGKEYAAPTALVDLSRPAFRLGMAELKVDAAAQRLDVQVRADQQSYPVRGTAQVTITAKLPNGQPAAGAEVAVAAVDQALLELMPNGSWNLLDAMLPRRAWGVQTATAQMEVIGRRHYGRKAVPAGGGGGRSPRRELFDSVLLWQPAVVLDAKGQAVVKVPLNDLLTSFEIVAVADVGAQQFGTGRARIRSTQDLQLLSGLPPLVREGDRFRAQLTLRNTTGRAMQVQVAARAAPLALQPQRIALAAGASQEVAWEVTVPTAPAGSSDLAMALDWEIDAEDVTPGAPPARDALRLRQRIEAAVPLTVQQATLVQIDGQWQVPVAPPADALPGRGGLQLSLAPRLADDLPSVRHWWLRYAYTCLEQISSRALALGDAAQWQQVIAKMPSYLDENGLASYFPPTGGAQHRGSDTLTAYLLAASHETARRDPRLALPDALRAQMESALIAFVEGRLERSAGNPRNDQALALEVRKLAAIEALSRHGRAVPRMLESIRIAPQQWPTHALIDWLQILQRLPQVAQREARLQEAKQLLQSRLSFQGTQVVFSTEKDDHWWWQMQGGDSNAARLLMTALTLPEWKDDVPRLALGLIARQRGGAWTTTTANLWGVLALQAFSRERESAPVGGITVAKLGAQAVAKDWAGLERGAVHPSTLRQAQGSGRTESDRAFTTSSAQNPFALSLSKGVSGQSPGTQQMFLPWTPGQLTVTHEGPGTPWLTLQSIAAIPLKKPFSAGYTVRKTVTRVTPSQLPAGSYRRGDVLEVRLDINATADMGWVAVTDPIPAGATILGSGLGRDSEIAQQQDGGSEGGEGEAPTFEERSFSSWRGYYEWLPRGEMQVRYRVRVSNVGEFALPPTRVEALYAPEMFGEAPNAPVKVLPAQ
ncbi:alpha-2-macroglobulin family protein [Comamonas endophytica]|uniref:MG2 domain-containing protein n=1 Tax=Comamonas endophytica TaxID=2949090 RepID=A0ABY6GDE9_9BURK|nr:MULTISPECIES: MG2 domain-containing protein [unclassified Acidovorax]MCD2513481.1 MG2 domain-containing protein [Acidovorax sp. D4N7]UYG52504.1 MG2 domain-containing protein [Acidovorax sp. 5MLIR]